MREKGRINITVAGRAGSGKTSIIELISKTLRLHGFTTAIDYGLDGDPEMTDERRHKILNAAAQKSEVHFNELHTRGDPIFGPNNPPTEKVLYDVEHLANFHKIKLQMRADGDVRFVVASTQKYVGEWAIEVWYRAEDMQRCRATSVGEAMFMAVKNLSELIEMNKPDLRKSSANDRV